MESQVKSKKVLMAISVLLLLLTIIGVSYAVWRISLVQTESNKIATSCFDITFKEDSEAINLENAYPILDEEGRTLTPYTFTITNNCENFAQYQINLEVLDTSSLNSQYVKVAIDNESAKKLVDKNDVVPTLENAKESYKLKTGYLDALESRTYNLRLWMDEDTPALEETMNKNFENKITITASYVPEIPTNVLMKGPEIDFRIDLSSSASNVAFSGPEYNTNVFLEGDILGCDGLDDFFAMIFIDSDSFWQYSNQILTINFESEINPPKNTVYSYDVSMKQDESIMAYLVVNDMLSEITEEDFLLYDLYIQSNGKIIANQDFSSWFAGMPYLAQINGLENLDTSQVIDMSNLFLGTGYIAYVFSLTNYAIQPNISLEELNTSNVKNMSGMFAYSFLPTILSDEIEKLDVSNVTSMANMFFASTFSFSEEDLKNINLTSWHVSKLENTSGMFMFSLGITGLDLHGLNFESLLDMSGMFVMIDTPLNTLNLSGSLFPKVTNVSWLFTNAENVYNTTEIDLSGFVSSNIQTTAGMFAGQQLMTFMNFDVLNTSNVTDMFGMFIGADVTNFDFSNLNTSNVKNMSYMFEGVRKTELDVSSFDTTNVTDMSYMFAYSIIDSLNISGFNTENVLNYEEMFAGDSGTLIKNVIYGPNFVYRNNANVKNMYYTVGNINKPTDPSWEGVL